MSDRQDADELRIFRLFVEAAGLDVAPGSIQKQRPPKPDIQCEVGENGPICFELVEVIDSDLARAVGNQVTLQQRLSEAAERQELRGFSNGLSYVRFADAATSSQRKRMITPLFALLEKLPDGFEGEVPLDEGSMLGPTVRSLRVSRGGFVGPCFQVDGTTFISDPLVERIGGKFSKTYETLDRLDLLAFYDFHPTQLAKFQLQAVEAFVRENVSSSQFSRVWVFDAGNRAVLYPFT